mgnify:CR=1 FL=1
MTMVFILNGRHEHIFLYNKIYFLLKILPWCVFFCSKKVLHYLANPILNIYIYYMSKKI